jgi:hypothetical protein
MRTVEIRRRRPEDGEIERLLRVHANGGEPAEFEVLKPEFREGLELLLADGVPDGSGEMLHLSDGETFVAALLDWYRSSRFWAEEVAEDPPP